jgi:hypothetical protein
LSLALKSNKVTEMSLEEEPHSTSTSWSLESTKLRGALAVATALNWEKDARHWACYKVISAVSEPSADGPIAKLRNSLRIALSDVKVYCAPHGFEPAIPTIERPQTDALDRNTWTGDISITA